MRVPGNFVTRRLRKHSRVLVVIEIVQMMSFHDL